MNAKHSVLNLTVKTRELHQDKGLLEVNGHLDLTQFWPTGTSDADTAHIAINLAASPFQFRPALMQQPKPTHVFDNAWVHGRQKPAQAIHGTNRNQPFVIVRFQGIDAPELHYQPILKGTADFRQVLGETCTVELEKSIKTGGPSHLIPCSVVTAVDHPGDAFDTFGRLIGDILIEQHGQTINLNHLLVESGWAFPSYYDSMTAQEIAAYQALLPKAKKNGAGVYGHLTAEILDIDWNLLFRSHGAIQQEPPGKNTVMPKIFRRLAAWSVKKKNGSTQESLVAYIKSLRPDEKDCILIEDFKQGKHVKTSLDQLILPNQVNGHFSKDPEDLVFVESPSKLFTQQQGGQEIKNW